jgi:hypothetical protein
MEVTVRKAKSRPHLPVRIATNRPARLEGILFVRRHRPSGSTKAANRAFETKEASN